MIAYEIGGVPRVFIDEGAVDRLPKLTRTIEADAGGWITLSEEPGLGIELDEDARERTLSHQATFA